MSKVFEKTIDQREVLKNEQEPEDFVAGQLTDLKNLLSTHFENPALSQKVQATQQMKVDKIQVPKETQAFKNFSKLKIADSRSTFSFRDLGN